VKPSVQPASLARWFRQVDGAVQNPSYEALIAGLRAEGMLVFDPGAALAAAARSDPQYLETDTHWRPEAMEVVAALLARHIESHVPLPQRDRPRHRIERVEVRNTGDTARMLDLPADSALFPPERVWLRRVLRDDGSSWRSSRDADVLVLGDSFTNIYSLESMGWGTSAGLVEQLSDALGRPLDRIVQNDEGAWATRARLAEEPARLAGKRLVVYQFAARELAFGDWKVVPLR
jgi:alginate O-acetyltransferase complex protein AlgJ